MENVRSSVLGFELRMADLDTWVEYLRSVSDSDSDSFKSLMADVSQSVKNGNICAFIFVFFVFSLTSSK